jgi:hypothetical protein
MNNKEIEERLKILEQRIVNLDAKFMGQIAVTKDRHILTNDRINELLERIQYLEREMREQ